MTTYKDLQEVFQISKATTVMAQIPSLPDDMINLICDFIPQRPYLKDLKTLFKLQKIWNDYIRDKTKDRYTYVPKSWVDGSCYTYEEFCVDKVENLVCDKLINKERKEKSSSTYYHVYKYQSSRSLYRMLLQKSHRPHRTTNINILPKIDNNSIVIQYYNTIIDDYGNVKMSYKFEKLYSMRNLKDLINAFNIYVPSKYKKTKKLLIQYLIKIY